MDCPCTIISALDYYRMWDISVIDILIVGEPKSRIVQKHTFFAPERYTTGILYTDSLNSA